jgi:capsular polysaccharide biosynthesis protein
MTSEEHERLIEKCDGLIAAFKKEYEELSTLANEVVEEYYTRVNEEFISTKITPKGLISKKLIVKMGIAFLLGVALAFVIAVFVTSFGDRLKINKKKKLIESIKARNSTEEA